MGLVASLARPGGNITGSQHLQDDLLGKRLQLLRDAVPRLSRVAYLDESVTRSDAQRAHRQENGRASARSNGLEFHFYTAGKSTNFPDLFSEMGRNGDDGLIVESSPFIFLNRKQIIELAARHRVPGNYNAAWYVEAGGLMSYGADRAALNLIATSFVDRILKGAKPSELPIEQAVKNEFAVNLKTAKALGLTIPPSVLARADRVIE